MGFDKTIESVDLTFITLKKLITFDLSIKTLGGPVMIAQMSGQAAAAGLSAFLSLLAMISISLGVLNLLPIPVLDGGMILFLVIEAIRKKPLSRKVMEVSQSIGAGLLITLIAVVSYNDVVRMFFQQVANSPRTSIAAPCQGSVDAGCSLRLPGDSYRVNIMHYPQTYETDHPRHVADRRRRAGRCPVHVQHGHAGRSEDA